MLSIDMWDVSTVVVLYGLIPGIDMWDVSTVVVLYGLIPGIDMWDVSTVVVLYGLIPGIDMWDVYGTPDVRMGISRFSPPLPEIEGFQK